MGIHAIPSQSETFAKPSPLMIQGGVEGGLDDAFRFEPPLSFGRFPRERGKPKDFAKVSRAGET